MKLLKLGKAEQYCSRKGYQTRFKR